MDTEAKSIKRIDTNSVHKICSGQVIFSLAVAVKELVENSLDAGATIIDIRLKNHGIDLIEVSDNGSGVTEDNFAGLTLKYHTSKLNEYSDLLGVASYGFRGEALSSLCALSDMTITTRHRDTNYGTKIEYDYKGNITKKTPCSRQVGTTISLCNLFCSLPVRQKEFHKNVKREFNKMTQLLYAYCLICLGVKITCSNQTNSSKSIVVATQGTKSYKDNIACIFGLKQLQSLLEIKPEYTSSIKENIFKGLLGEVEPTDESVQLEDVEIDLSEESSNDADTNQTKDSESIPKSQKSQGYVNVVNPVELTGFISSCEHGAGRSSADRQFYYVNSRPCEPTKIMKLVNEVYKQYNSNQYPFIFLNINLDRTFVDVNVTPDKRKVFLTKEKIILESLKDCLHKLFVDIPRTIKLESTNCNKSMTQEVKPELSQQRIFNSFMQQFSNKSSVNNDPKSPKIDNQNVELKRKSTTMLDFVSSKTIRLNDNVEQIETVEENDVNNISDENIITDKKDHKENISIRDRIQFESDEIEAPKEFDSNVDIKNTSTRGKILFEEEPNNGPSTSKEMLYLDYTDNMPNTQIRNVADVITEKSHTIRCKTTTLTPKGKTIHKEDTSPKIKNVITDREDLGKSNRKTVTMKTCLDHVNQLCDIYNKQKSETAPERVKFKTGINPVFNKKCEEELSKEISKDSFKEMKIVGQFNLGFIVARLEDDLFIIDQHATDEIYNFETLQKTTELTSQKLVIPQSLELTGANEQILMDHVDVFKKNGFIFEINENALPTKRVKLLTLPMSKNVVFGKEDIEELLFMLRESPTSPLEQCRPSRVRAMFASRACRKSVMIGTALTKADMKILVNHMGEIDKPWNCPHGRPTIRHLVNLAMVHSKE